MPVKRSSPKKTQNLKRAFAITPGDPDGIGPEILIELFRSKSLPKGQNWVIIGAEKPFQKVLDQFQIGTIEGVSRELQNLNPRKWGLFIPAPREASIRDRTDGNALSIPGYQCGWSIENAARLVLNEICSAMITGPIDKQRFNQGGFHFSGHTDFLAFLARGHQPMNVTMMLYNSHCRVSLVTTHLPLKDVSKAITRDKIVQAGLNTEKALVHWFQIQKPRIAVLSLNPHGGDGGLLGIEEREVIRPAIEELKTKLGNQSKVEGPFPADSFFANYCGSSIKTKSGNFDAILAMYHDQGLIPVKLLDFKNTVNITLGLPFIRTSVDHGVAFDIVGKKKADPSSFRKAIEEAVILTRR